MSDVEEKKDSDDLLHGIVEEALPNTLFRVRTEDDDGQTILAYLSGRMRKFRIRVLVGDRVTIQPDKYGGKGRITKRL